MSTSHLVRILLFVGIAAECSGQAAFGLVASLSNEGDPTVRQAVVLPGNSLAIDINLASDEEIVSVSMKLEASSSGLASITSGTYHAPWDVASNPIPLGPLMPVSDYIDATVPPFDPQPVSSPLATIALAIDPNAELGTYTLNLVDIYYATSRITTVLRGPGEPGPAFSVRVVPEPTSSSLLLVSAFVLSTGRRA